MPEAIYLNLDDAWDETILGLPTEDVRNFGPKLRYITRRRDIEAFYEHVRDRLAKTIVYGSGDFHHLAGVLIRRVGDTPFTLLSFDNHPDWDVRPPYWSCGGWAARALNGAAERVSVWGCGNYELTWPSRLFRDRKVLKSGRLSINAWAERQAAAVQKRFDCMTRENWRQRFQEFARSLSGCRVYITVDMDCLIAEQAATNWENGLFTADDVAWAVTQLRGGTDVIGSDICGAWSHPSYARWWQKLAGRWDHPQVLPPDAAARQTTHHSLQVILSSLC